MKDDRFKIFVQRLKEGEPEQIVEVFDPGILDMEDDHLLFRAPIHVKGQAHVSNKNFFLVLDVDTQVMMPCIICNEFTKVAISIRGMAHTQSMDELKSGVFHMQEMIREGLLLEVPSKAECGPDTCPERQALQQYFSKEK